MDNELPEAMNVQDAELWLAFHPEVDVATFWLDQATKHHVEAAKGLRIAAWALIVISAINAALAIWKLFS